MKPSRMPEARAALIGGTKPQTIELVMVTTRRSPCMKRSNRDNGVIIWGL